MAMSIEKRSVTTTPSALGLDQRDVSDYYSVVIAPVDGSIRLLNTGSDVVADGFPIASGASMSLDLRRNEEVYLASDAGTVDVRIIAQGV